MSSKDSKDDPGSVKVTEESIPKPEPEGQEEKYESNEGKATAKPPVSPILSQAPLVTKHATNKQPQRFRRGDVVKERFSDGILHFLPDDDGVTRLVMKVLNRNGKAGFECMLVYMAVMGRCGVLE